MRGRAKVAAGGLAACAAAAAALTAPGPVGGQASDIGINGVVFELGGEVKGIVHASRPSRRQKLTVGVSLHGLTAGARYEIVATRRRCSRMPSDGTGLSGITLWKATVQPEGDDVYASLNVPLGPDRAIGAGGAGLYLMAADGSRTLQSCAPVRRYVSRR